MDQKTTKNSFTKAFCKKELKALAELDRHIAITFFVACGLLFGLMDYFILTKLVYLVKPIIWIPVLLMVSAPVIYWLYQLVRSLLKIRMVKRENFSIVTDTVAVLSRDEFVRGGRGRDTENAIYFSTYGRYAVSGVSFEISSINDEFYLVILHTKKPMIVMAFPKKLYEYQEENEA